MPSESHNRRSAASARPPLYVVWEIDDRDPEDTRRTVVTDPMPLPRAEQFARDEARLFAGHLEVAPARPEDFDDEDDQAAARPSAFNARARILMEDAQEIVGAGSARDVAARMDGIDLDDEVAVLREAFGAARARLADVLAIADEAGQAVCSVGQHAAELGRDEALREVGYVILHSREHGEPYDETLTWVMDLIDLRMCAGSEDAVELLTGAGQ